MSAFQKCGRFMGAETAAPVDHDAGSSQEDKK